MISVQCRNGDHTECKGCPCQCRPPKPIIPVDCQPKGDDGEPYTEDEIRELRENPTVDDNNEPAGVPADSSSDVPEPDNPGSDPAGLQPRNGGTSHPWGVHTRRGRVGAVKDRGGLAA